MHYYIDGYNLLFRIIRGPDEVAKRRQLLIADLHRKICLLELDVTLVFDAQYFPGGREKSHFDELEIVFTSMGKTADQLIIDSLDDASDPFNETVVTSDKKLAWYARLRSAKTVTVEEFIDWLNRRYRNKLKQLRSSPSKEPLPLPEKVKEPKKAVAGSQEYYLQAFETEFKHLEAAEPKKEKVKPESKRKKEIPNQEPEEKITDFERWLEAFERKLDE